MQNVNAVINSINQITAAWNAQHKHITRNALIQQTLLNEQLKTVTNLAQATVDMGKSSSNAFGNISGNAKLATGAIIGASIAVGNLAGKLAFLGKMAGGIGGALGTIIGGPAGGIAGGAIGALGGNIFGAIINIPFQIIGSFGKMFKYVIDGFARVGSSIKNFLFGPVSLFGLFVGNIFKDMFTGVKEFAGSIFDAATAFQQLNISIETLTRRNIARDLGIDIIAVNADEASVATKSLFNWLKKISLTSPFTMASIADAMKFASAMGLSTDMTKQLTIATGDFAAAMGLSEDHQYRIMYNLAQIYQQGKLTGREFRDLAISFVPVYDILGEMAKEAGTSTEAFKKLALEGGVPVEEFFTHFIGYMERNFPDAMKRMSRTMIGVKNNIKDFIQVVLGMEVLGPLINDISGRLADVLDKLLSPTTHNIATDFGIGLSRAFKLVADAVDGLGRVIRALFDTIGLGMPTLESFEKAWVTIYLTAKYAINFLSRVIGEIHRAVDKYIMPIIASLAGVQKYSGSWGVNLIKNFAEGMVRGAAKFLATAIVYIAAIIKGFFVSNSPPKIAPEIDQWGANTMNEWIKGAVYGAKWNILGKGVSNQLLGLQHPPLPVPGTVKTGPEREDIPYGQATPAPPIQQSIAKAVSVSINFVTEQGMKLAAALMHGFSDAMFSALDEIQAPVKSALDALSGLGLISKQAGFEMFYDFSVDTMQALDDFNKTGQMSADLIEEISQLGMGLGPELADLVQKEFDLVKATNDATLAQKRLDEAIEALGKARTNVHSLVKDYNALLRAGADKSVLKTKLKEINAAEGVVTQAVKEQKVAEENKKLADERVEATKELVNLQSKLVDNMIELLNIQESAMRDAASGMSELGEDLADTLAGLGESVEDALGDWTPFDWEEEEGKQGPAIKGFLDGLGDIFATTLEETMAELNTSGAATKFVENLKQSIADILGMQIQTGGYYISPTQFVPAKSFFQQIVDAIFSGQVDWSNAIDLLVGKLTDILTEAINNILTEVSTEGTALHTLVVDIGYQIGKAIVTGFWSGVTGKIGEGLQGQVEKGGIPKFLDSIGLNVMGKPEGFETGDYVGPWSQEVYNRWNGMGPVEIDATPVLPPNFKPEDWIQTTVVETAASKVGTSWFDGMVSGIIVGLATLPLKIVNWLNKDILPGWFNAIDGGSPAMKFAPVGKSIVDGIIKGVADAVLNIIGPNGAIATEMKKIIDKIKNIFGIGSNSKEQNPLYSIGQSIVQGLIDGFQSMIDEFVNAWNSLISILPKQIRDLLELDSPSRVMIEIGRDIGMGLIEGIEDSFALVKKASSKISVSVPNAIKANMATYAPSATRSTGGVVNKINNVTFGDVYLNNNMDWEVFKTRVQKVMTGG